MFVEKKTKEMLRNLGIVLLVAMFLGSGLRKVARLGNIQTKQFTEVFKLPFALARALVLAAGVLEVAAVALIVVGESKGQKKFSRMGVLALAGFTVVATLAFKVYPKFKQTQFAANMSVLGGLLLFYTCLE